MIDEGKLPQALFGFMTSNAWAEAYSLPLVPMHNNPWIYMAYAIKVMRVHDRVDPLVDDITPVVHIAPIGDEVGAPESEYKWFRTAFKSYLAQCEVRPGLLSRWPELRGGQVSHDEAFGAGYLDKEFARRLIQYLTEHDGQYDVTGETIPGPITEERYNIKRFTWLMPALQACAEYRVSLLTQLTFSLKLLGDMWKGRNAPLEDGSGKLLTWLALEPMCKYPLSELFCKIWASFWEKRGVTPKSIFTNQYLVEAPAFAKFAPEKWIVNNG